LTLDKYCKRCLWGDDCGDTYIGVIEHCEYYTPVRDNSSHKEYQKNLKERMDAYNDIIAQFNEGEIDDN